MSYVALYRKYRPQTFDDVIGQDHIVNTLKNQIANGKVSHAYLFTGTRGTGKTSTAKIFARAVNCLNAQSDGGNPCGSCAVCQALSHTNVDVVEMDAASNNGVDYARDIREKVQFPPVNCRYKVYIIDEVHMLSIGAFNALLKTLEEPPKHVIFVLCTTEVHKLPQTIVSRCMRFDFRLVSTRTLADHIASVFDKEDKQYTREAVEAIAQAGEGSVRDAMSIADRCFTVGEGELTYDDVMNVLGVSSQDSIAVLANAVLQNMPADILTEIDKLVKEGKDVARLAKDLSVYFRDVLTIKLCKNPNEMLCLPEDIFSKMHTLSQNTTTEKLLYAIDTLVGLENALRFALSPLMLFEASCLKIARSTGEVDVEGLERRLTRLEQQPQNISQDSQIIVDITDAQSIWRGIKVRLDALGKPLLSAVWKEVAVKLEDNKFVVICGKSQFMLVENEYKKDIQQVADKVCGKAVVVVQKQQETQQSVDDQLKNLGENVTFKDN